VAVELPEAGGPVVGARTETAAVIVERRGVRGWLAAHPLAAYVIRRLVLYVVTLWAAITATFFFFRLIPGDPVQAFIQNLKQNHVYNVGAGQAVIDHYQQEFGLNGSLLEQYGRYMYQLVIVHDMGPSLLNYPVPAQVVIGNSLPWTIALLTVATVIAWVLGVALGAIAGWWRDSPLSGAITYVSVAVSHIPYYFVGLVLVFYLAYRAELLPAQYAYDATVAPGITPAFLLSVLQHALLPALSIVIVVALGNILGMRQQMVTVLGEDYLTFAQAKGLRPLHILRRYAMPNCYLPQITGLLISFGAVFGGNVLVEQLFLYPGVGHLFVEASQQLDLNVMMGISDLGIFTVLTAVLIVDLILPLLDPRIKYAR
jgi:peptide/nickel transport system permease protein